MHVRTLVFDIVVVVVVVVVVAVVFVVVVDLVVVVTVGIVNLIDAVSAVAYARRPSTLIYIPIRYYSPIIPSDSPKTTSSTNRCRMSGVSPSPPASTRSRGARRVDLAPLSSAS